ncbi:hypothetical protein PG997_010295 [Apiospora hydei]|uniref:Uncharacterized protein n=1 Tax=Apiospora hydei TaxID=1337664 RepID=A0ABR1VWL9_9PEZI
MTSYFTYNPLPRLSCLSVCFLQIYLAGFNSLLPSDLSTRNPSGWLPFARGASYALVVLALCDLIILTLWDSFDFILLYTRIVHNPMIILVAEIIILDVSVVALFAVVVRFAVQLFASLDLRSECGLYATVINGTAVPGLRIGVPAPAENEDPENLDTNPVRAIPPSCLGGRHRTLQASFPYVSVQHYKQTPFETEICPWALSILTAVLRLYMKANQSRFLEIASRYPETVWEMRTFPKTWDHLSEWVVYDVRLGYTSLFRILRIRKAGVDNTQTGPEARQLTGTPLLTVTADASAN